MITMEELQALAQFRAQAEEQLAAMQQQIDGITQALDEFRTSLIPFLTGQRRVKRNQHGQAEALEILGDDGTAMFSQAILRDGSGRVLGSQ